RVFAKVSRDGTRGQLLRTAVGNREEGGGNNMANERRLSDLAFDADPVAQLVVDPEGAVSMLNERARVLFGLGGDDLVGPRRDLAGAYRTTALRSVIDEVAAERRPIVRRDVAWPGPAGESRYLDVHAVPLVEADGNLEGTKLSFVEVTRVKHLQDEL